MFRTKEPMNVTLFADWTRGRGVKAGKGVGKAVVSLMSSQIFEITLNGLEKESSPGSVIKMEETRSAKRSLNM